MKNNRKIFVSIGVILSVLALLIIFAFRQEAQTTQREQDDPPTPIQLGLMSEKQRINSKKYNRPPEVPSLLLRNRDVLRGIGESIFAEEIPGNLPPQEVYFRNPTCRSDSVVIGKVRGKNSQLSEDTKSVFTDYDFEVLDILKNSAPLPLRPNDIITVTRSGGVIKLNNRRIEVVNAAFKRLKVGKHYLLFLSYLNDSSSFAPNTVEGTFEIQGNRITRLRSKNPPYRNSRENLNDFLSIIRGIVPTCSTQGGK